MLDRAKNCSYRQGVLIKLRYAEVSMLMRMSAKIGKRGSVDIFLAAIQFALPVWETAHAETMYMLDVIFYNSWNVRRQ